jgi:type II secretory pathway component GspD/PulD (secretin)
MRSFCCGILCHTWIAIANVIAVIHAAPLHAQETPISDRTVVETADGTTPLRFSFEGAPWRDVVKWLATESDMALHVGDLPTGSFTYSDPNSFTPQEAIDRVNLFLLPQGFTLVRTGKLLAVINLGDPRSMQQLDALAKLVTVQQLEQLSDHTVVKCMFPLGDLEADEAVEELTALKLMTTPAGFSKTNQLMITDTAGKLKNVKAILDSFQSGALDSEQVVKSFALQHVDAEDVLAVARPHLGLATGEMIGIDVSLSADVNGKNIYVTGPEDKVALIEGLINAIDKPEKSHISISGEAELRSHVVNGGNVETIYNVLQTLLAGKPVRLSTDEKASSIVALATPDVQTEISQTVAQLQASEADFEVIPLKTVDPYLAISLLEEMLDLPDPLSDKPEDIDPDAPKIDADPGNMRLFVRAKKPQIEHIKKIVAGLDSTSTTAGSDEIRILPLKGNQAVKVLQIAAKFWRGANPVVLFPSTVENETKDTERVANGESTTMKRTGVPRADADTPGTRFLTDNIRSQAPAIRCQLTPRGLLLQSDDTEALEQFEQHVRTIAGPIDSTPSPPIAFYLKYTKADDAIRMLAELLDGSDTATEHEAGSLVNGYVSGSSTTFLASLVTARGGTTTMTAGTITVVADSRLNRVIAQGTAGDIELIENYLKIIDKDNSITSVETYGTSHVIELLHTKASEVAAVIYDAYAGRVLGGGGGGRPNEPGSSQQGERDAAKPKADEGEQKGDKQAPDKKPANQLAGNLEPKMTIAVHEPSNSLIVTAPDQLFKEVEQLAMRIDARNEQAVEVVTFINAEGIGSVLQQAISGGAATNTGGTRPSSRPPSPSQQASPPSSSLRNRVARDTERESNR